MVRTVGAIACASPSAARQVLAWHPWTRDAAWVAVGATTAAALHALGVSDVTIARSTGARSLADALVDALGTRPPLEAP